MDEDKDTVVLRYVLDGTKDIQFRLQGFGFGDDFEDLTENKEYQRVLNAYVEFTKNVFGYDFLGENENE